MDTILGTKVKEGCKGVLYLCELDYENKTLKVHHEMFYTSIFGAIEAYANIPNPESQLVTGKTYEDLKEELKRLHKNMQDPEWVEMLIELI